MAVGVCSVEHVDRLCRLRRWEAELCRRPHVDVTIRQARQEVIDDFIHRSPFKKWIAGDGIPTDRRIHRDSIDVQNAIEIIVPGPETSFVASGDLVGHLDTGAGFGNLVVAAARKATDGARSILWDDDGAGRMAGQPARDRAELARAPAAEQRRDRRNGGRRRQKEAGSVTVGIVERPDGRYRLTLL